MSLPDIAGLVGVGLMLCAYALGQFAGMDMTRPPALLMNLSGSLMVLWSLIYKFNLPAFLMETAWALVALYGLIRVVMRQR